MSGLSIILLWTDEDRKRNAYYEQGASVRSRSPADTKPGAVHGDLDLKVRISPVSAEQIPRVAQLTQRTNQFNFTGVRRSEADIRA